MKKSLFTAFATFPFSKSFLCAAVMFSISASFAQAPHIEWQKALGGSSSDVASSIQQTADGGYIVAGYSYSNDGDVTGNHGQNDYWIVKLDGNGNTQWQKALGGSSGDEAQSIQQTADGGYIVAGLSWSNSGDVIGNHGISDYWVVKLDGNGNIQWQKALGGSGYDKATSIQQTADGGYIVVGETYSNDGDVTGYHGGGDYWVMKLDDSGNIQWQKSLGGSNLDVATSIQQTADEGYIVAGYSYSNDGDVSGNHGDGDFWVVKLAGNGNIQWQKVLGGSYLDKAYSIQQTADGEYIVAGESLSTDGDVTGNHGSLDYWVVKLADTISGTKNIDFTGNVAIYPNPTAQELTIDLTGSEFSAAGTVVTLFDIQGRKALEKEITNFISTVDVGRLEKGMYFLRVENKERYVVNKVVID